METAVDGKGPETPDTPRPRWEKHISQWVPRKLRQNLLKDLERQHKQQHDDHEYVKEVAKNLSWMIPAMAVEGFALALFVADILMFAVIGHSIVSAAMLLGVAVGMFALWVSRGRYYPYPSSLGEVIIDALIAMFFCVVTVLLVLWVSPSAVPLSVLVRFVATGVVGLTLTGMSFYFPNWNPKKYTESNCAYYWSVALNTAWAIAWFAVINSGPVTAGPSRFDSTHGLSPLLVLVPMFVLYAMCYFRASKDGINMAKKNDPEGVSLDPLRRQIHDIKRKRVILYTFRGGLGEAVFFGSLGANLLIQAFLRPNFFDPLRFATNAAGSVMLVAVWRYIRRANRRADTLLEKRLQAL